MLPSRARLFMCPFSDAHWRGLRADMLRDVCGVDVSALASQLAIEEASEPAIQGVDPEQLNGEPQCIVDLDIATVTIAEAFDRRTSHQWHVAESAPVHGFAGWFDVIFDPPAWSPNMFLSAPPLASRFQRGASEERPHLQSEVDRVAERCTVAPAERVCGQLRQVVLSTAPRSPRTCWHQTLFYLPSAALELRRGQVLFADISLIRSTLNRRFLEVRIDSRTAWEQHPVRVGSGCGKDDDAPERVSKDVMPKAEREETQTWTQRRDHEEEGAADADGVTTQKGRKRLRVRSPTPPGDCGISSPQPRTDEVTCRHSWMLRSYAREGVQGAPLPVARLRGTSRAACYGGAA